MFCWWVVRKKKNSRGYGNVSTDKKYVMLKSIFIKKAAVYFVFLYTYLPMT